MKTCDDARAALVDRIFGELDEPAGAALDRHLRACPACAREEARLLALRDVVRGPVLVPSAGLEARVAAELARTPRPMPDARRHRAPVLVAAAAVLLVAVIVAVLPQPRTIEGPDAPHAGSPRTALEGGLPFTVAVPYDTRIAVAALKPDSTPGSQLLRDSL